MKSKRSWKWLVPRLVTRDMRNAAGGTKAIARPCLAVEPLEERHVLDATTIGPPPTPTDAQVVGDLLSGGLQITTDEFRLLQACANGKHIAKAEIVIRKTVDKASVELFRLNDTVMKLAQDVIKGQLTDKKLMAAENKIEFLKIKLEDIVISSIGTDSASSILTPLFDDTNKLVDELVSLRKAGKGQQEYIKLSMDVLAMEDLTIKGEADFIEGQSPGLTVDDFQVKIDFVAQKANKEILKLNLDDATTMALTTEVSAFHDGVNNLLGSLSGGGDFEGGVVVPPPNKTAS